MGWLLLFAALIAAAAAAKKAASKKDPPVLNPGTDQTSTLVVFEHFTDNEAADGSTIAIMPLDKTSDPIHLTTTGLYRDHWPHPSPDGTRILFARDPKGTTGNTPQEIWVMNTDGTNPTRIMSMTTGDNQNNENDYDQWGHHEWVNNNTLIFSGSADSDTTYAIWTCDDDGTNHQRLTDGTQASIDPSVCGDGRILFTRTTTGSLGHLEPWIMDPDGTNQTQISDDTTASRTEQADYDPYCSPDGTRIVSLRQVALFQYDNVLQNIDGTGWTTIADASTEGAIYYGVAGWVNDNLLIGHRSTASAGSEIITYDPDNPATKTVLIHGATDNHYRGAVTFDHYWPL